MKKCCFIIPYFGKLPNYFQLFLNSCKFNPDFNWLLFTDDRTEYEYPENVKKIDISFSDIKKYINGKFGDEVALLRPYKFCDLKPMYGYIFEDYLKGYKSWGHCDLDTIMGNLSKFITDDMIDSYDKLFTLGHMTIYKNTYENNRIFMCKHNGRELYKDILHSENNNWFDEEWKDDNNINQIFKRQRKKVFEEDLSLNIDNLHNAFLRIKYVGKETAPTTNGYVLENRKQFVCLWINGSIIRYYKQNEIIVEEEFPYIHLQGRKMRCANQIELCKLYKIIPDAFMPLEIDHITVDNFNRILIKYRCYHMQRIWINKLANKLGYKHKLWK